MVLTHCLKNVYIILMQSMIKTSFISSIGNYFMKLEILVLFYIFSYIINVYFMIL